MRWTSESCIHHRTSKPSFIAGNPSCFNPVGSVQLGDGLGEIVTYSPLCQSQRTRQFSSRFPVARAAQNQTFSIGERVLFRAPYLRGKLGIHDTSPATNCSDCVSKFFRGPVLEKVARCSSFQRSSQIARTREGRQDQDACVRVKLFYTAGEFESAHLRHLNVGHQNLRPVLSDGVKGLLPIGKGSQHLDIGFNRKQRGECSPQHALVLGQHHMYRLRQRLSACPTICGADSAGGSLAGGKVISRLIPSSAEPASFTAPATDRTLSLMPRRPLPSRICPPTPLSSIVKRIVLSVSKSATRQTVA